MAHRFRIFDSQRVGRGVSRNDLTEAPGFHKFFVIWKENFFNRLLSVNILMILSNFPLIFPILALFAGIGQELYLQPVTGMFPAVFGVNSIAGHTPATLAGLGVSGLQTVQAADTPLTYIFLGIGVLGAVTLGLSSVGVHYILRNLATRRPIFLLSDFFDTVRKNFKQALIFGIIDAVVLSLLVFNIYQLVTNEVFLASFMFWTNIVILVFWYILRRYAYLQISSFNLGLFKIIKNAAYFVLLGFKRNILAVLGSAFLFFLTFIFAVFFNGTLVIIALAIPILLLFSNSAFMGVYAAWYKIEEIMVIKEDAPTDGEDTDAPVEDDAPTE